MFGQMPEWQIDLIILPLLILSILGISFALALFVEWYRGWPHWR